MSEKELTLTATLDAQAAYTNADFVVIAAPTNYDSQKNFFDTSAVEAVIELVLLPNYAMNERFSTTKKLYHELQQIVKRFLEMKLIVAFKEPTRLMLLVIPQSPRRNLRQSSS